LESNPIVSGSEPPARTERIILITQDEPLFLRSALNRLLTRMPAGARVVGCVLLASSPFAKRESLPQKLLRTYRVFGAGFTIHYLARYAIRMLQPWLYVGSVLKRHEVKIIRLSSSINSLKSLDTIRRLEPDLLISIAGNEIFRLPLLELAPHGCLNLHSALLPKYRGLLPSFWVLKNKERESGVSVFEVDEAIDAGPILVQKRFAIEGLTQEQVIRRGKELGADAVIEAVEMIMRGDMRRIANDDSEATYFSFPTAEDIAAFRASGGRFY
jgi:methionyl-tRNA formyltransferase